MSPATIAPRFRPREVESVVDKLWAKYDSELDAAFLASVRKTLSTKDARRARDYLAESAVVPSVLIRRLHVEITPLARVFAKAARDAHVATMNAYGQLSKAAMPPDLSESLLAVIAELSDDLDATAREAVVVALTKAIRGNLSPAELREVFDNSMFLNPQLALAVENLRAGLVAKDVAPGSARSSANQYALSLRRSRAATVARTELAKAVEAGKMTAYDEILSNVGMPTGYAELEWLVTKDDRLCRKCVAMDGDRTSYDSPAWSAPLHPNCRCTTLLVFPDISKGDYS